MKPGLILPIELELRSPNQDDQKSFSENGIEQFIQAMSDALVEALKLSMADEIIPKQLILKGQFEITGIKAD